MQFYVLLFRFVTKMLESVRTTDPTYIAGSGFRIETKKMGSRYAKVNVQSDELPLSKLKASAREVVINICDQVENIIYK